MRVLVVEDDLVLTEVLTVGLRAANFTVTHIANGLEADHALATQAFDLVVLDIGLPGIDGFEVMARLRKRGQTIPVLMLTALSSVENRVQGLELGADDYAAKPFVLKELVARLRALARRAYGRSAMAIRHGEVFCDPVAHTAKLDDTLISLTEREYELFEIFVTRSGRNVEKEQIVSLLSHWGGEVSSNAVEVYVYRLRKKLEISRMQLRTVRGMGYCLDVTPAAG